MKKLFQLSAKKKRRKKGEHASSSSSSVSSSPTTSSAASSVEPSKRAKLCKMLLDMLLFYTTAFFVLLAVCSTFALIFLVPFFIDPALATLRADFDPRAAHCTTVMGVYREGKSQCTWSSCEEGCTKTVYTCWQVHVEYSLPLSLPSTAEADREGEGEESPEAGGLPSGLEGLEGRRRGRLFPNVKGCGYPPRTVCMDFVARYAGNGSTFPCYVSRTDPTLVVINLDLDQVRRDLFYSLAIPIPCLVVSILYVVVAYFFIYTDPPEKSYRPVAILSTAGAMSALINPMAGIAGGGGGGLAGDTAAAGGGGGGGGDHAGGGEDDGDEETERQRRMVRLQAQRAKLLATQQHAHGKSTAFMIRSAVASATASAVSLPDLVAKKEASATATATATVTKDDVAEKKQKKTPESAHFDVVQKDRKEYGQEKYSVMQYYQYYGIL